MTDTTKANNQFLILLVDDHPAILEMLQMVLEWEGFKTLTCSESSQVIALTQKHKPHLIILDVMMPYPNGWQVYQALQQTSETALVPVIMMTANSVPTNSLPEDLVINATTRLMTKPLDNNHLLETIQQLLALSKTHEVAST